MVYQLRHCAWSVNLVSRSFGANGTSNIKAGPIARAPNISLYPHATSIYCYSVSVFVITKEGLFYLTTPLAHIDVHIIGY